MKCKYEGSGVWKDRCVGTKEVDPCIGYEKCERYRPNCKTNADHIRSMTDEELAELLLNGNSSKVCPNGCDGCDGDCDGKMLNWLKQPYKEGV